MIIMEMNAKGIARALTIKLVAIYVIAVIIAAVFEIGLISKGLIFEVSTIYTMEVIGVVISLGLIPISLKGFKKAVSRVSEKKPNRKVVFYMFIAGLRLLAFLVVIEYGVLLYYLVNDTIGLYCALIGFICSIFCFPSVSQVESELGSDE